MEASGPGPGLVEGGHVYINRYPVCKFFSYVRTALGVITVFVLFSAAIDSLISITAIPVAIYLGVVTVPVFLLEFGKIIRTCCGTNGALCNVFSLVLNFDRWKRGLFYAVLAVPCFFPAIANTMSKAAGVFLFVCGCMYVAKVFQKKKVPVYINDPNSVSTNPTPR